MINLMSVLAIFAVAFGGWWVWEMEKSNRLHVRFVDDAVRDFDRRLKRVERNPLGLDRDTGEYWPEGVVGDLDLRLKQIHMNRFYSDMAQAQKQYGQQGDYAQEQAQYRPGGLLAGLMGGVGR